MRHESLPDWRGIQVRPIWRFLVTTIVLAIVLSGIMPAGHANQSGTSQGLTRFGYTADVLGDVTQAAQDGLRSFWNAIPQADIEKYGFPQETGFESISLGLPYRVMTIAPEALFAYTAGEDIRSMLRATDMWFFPILLSDVPRAILTVDLVEGRWTAVAIGSAGLASQFSGIDKAWPESSGYVKILTRIFQATSDIMIVVSRDAVRVVPLASARMSLSLPARDETEFAAWQADEIINRLVPVVRDNINNAAE